MGKLSFSLTIVAALLVAAAESVTMAPVTTAPVGIPIGSSPAPALGSSSPTSVSYLTNPLLKWSVSLGFDFGELARGNAVTVSDDGSLLFVTRSSGRIDILQASDGATIFSYSPTALSGWTVSCSSGVHEGTFFGQNFLVYAIIDEPPTGSGLEAKSRLVAIALPTGAVWWISEAVDGRIIGTPVATELGEYVYATHNINLSGTDPEGIFSIFSVKGNGTVIFSEKATARNTTDIAPYSALAYSHMPTGGNYAGGSGNTNDIVAWISTRSDGVGDAGYTRAFQLPQVFSSSNTSNAETVLLRPVRWNGLARPTLSMDGQSLFAVVRESGVRGWIPPRTFEGSASWSVTLAKNNVTSAIPIRNAATLSTSQSFVFVTSTSTELSCLTAADGIPVWNSSSSGLFTTEPQVAPDDFLVYTTDESGALQARRQSDGTALWAVTCESLSLVTNCSNILQAEFSVSSSGLYVYYGDLSGNIKAIQVALTTSPTIAPSAGIAATSAPSMTPVAPTIAPVAPVTTAPISIAPVAAPVVTTTAPILGPVTTAPVMPPNEVTVAPVANPTTDAPSPSPSTPLTTSRPATAKPTSAASKSFKMSIVTAAVIGMGLFMN